MATNDVYLRIDAGDGTNGVRLRIDAADGGGTISVSSITTDGADISAATLDLIVAMSSATTDNADTNSANVGPIVGITSATTDGSDTSSVAVSPIVAFNSATTDGADVSAATVDPQSDVISASSETTDGADEIAATLTDAPGPSDQASNWQANHWAKSRRTKKEQALLTQAERVMLGILPPELDAIASSSVKDAHLASSELAAKNVTAENALAVSMQARQAFEDAYVKAFKEVYTAEMISKAWVERMKAETNRRAAMLLLLH